jgi:dolichol-phosphate mannosyltransferase
VCGSCAEVRLPINLKSPEQAPIVEPLGSLPFPLEPRTGRPRVAIVVPVFNEEKVIESTYRRIAEAMARIGVDWTLLFVNDGSRDRSGAELEAVFSQDDRVSYLVLSRNFGHQAALAAGLDHADGDVVITMDADLQHPPELIADMLAAWQRGYDVVHTRKLATDGLSPLRSFTTRVAYRAISGVASVPIVERASDFRLLDREAVAAVQRMPEGRRLYRGLTPWVGFRQAVIPFAAPAREAGASQYGLRQLVSLFSRSFFDFSRGPLYAGLIAGAVAIALCFAYLVYVVAAYAAGKRGPAGFVSIIVAIVFVSSVNLCFAGIIGVYVARIYDEVRQRPSYVIGRARMRARPSPGETNAELTRDVHDHDLQDLPGAAGR